MILNENKKIVLYVGLIGSGKSTRAKKLIAIGDYIKLSFADGVREQAFLFQGYTPKNYDNYKARLLYLDQLPTFISKMLKFIFPNWLYGREYLQNIGHKQRKFNGDTYWIDQVIKEIINSDKNIVIDDCRYKNELMTLVDFAKENDYKLEVIFCDYRSHRYNDKSTHPTEQLALWLRDRLRDGDNVMNIYDSIIHLYKGE